MLWPPRITRSLARPVIQRKPSLSSRPRSPELTQPSVDERALVVGVVEIAAEHAGPCHADDADLVRRAVALEAALGVELDDAHAAVGHRQAGRAETDRPFRIGDGVDARGLGHAVDFEHRQLELVLDRLADRDRNRRSAGGGKLQARNIGVAGRNAERGRQHRRHAGKRLAFVAIDQAPDVLDGRRVAPARAATARPGNRRRRMWSAPASASRRHGTAACRRAGCGPASTCSSRFIAQAW